MMKLTRRHAGLIICGASLLSGRLNAAPAHAVGRPKRRTPAPADAPTAHAVWLTLPPTPALPDAKRTGMATANGTSIFFAQFGDGPPVLLLHGGLGNSNYWGHQVAELAKSFSVTVMDTRGHGRSPLTSRTFGYHLFAEDVAGLLDFLEIPAAAIVGWSDGAITGLQLAMTRPHRVSKLFAFGANGSVDGLKPNGAKNPVFAAYVARCRSEYARLSPRPDKWPQLLDGLGRMWRTEPNFTAQKLAGVTPPTAISDGEYDEIIKPEHTERMCRDIPGAQLMIQRQVSHFAMLQNAAQFNRLLIEFLTAQS